MFEFCCIDLPHISLHKLVMIWIFGHESTCSETSDILYKDLHVLLQNLCFVIKIIYKIDIEKQF